MNERVRPVGVAIFTAIVVLAAASEAPAQEAAQTKVTEATPAAAVQTECPVMIHNKIDPSIHTTYKGKKVYFCCQSCLREFESQPDKYVSRLPQFAAASVAHTPSQQDSRRNERDDIRVALIHLIEPLGAVTLSLLALAVGTGLFRRRWKPRLMLRIHMVIGITAFVSGAIHGGLVLVLF